MRVLITGGTGSLGQELLRLLPGDLTVYSRDELKQWTLEAQYPGVQFELGDVRDKERLTEVMRGHRYVVHAAALKRLEAPPTELVQTNVTGSINVVEAAREVGVEKVLGVSTDKAAGPVTAYGATKLLMERVFSAASNDQTRLACARLVNLAGSRGSLVPFWAERAKAGLPLPLTDRRMTRHWMSLEEGARFLERCLEQLRGGEVLVPKTRSFRIIDLWSIFSTAPKPEEIGPRAGEKLHEELLTRDELRQTEDRGWCYALSPRQPAEDRRGDLSLDTSSERDPMPRTKLVDELRRLGYVP